MKGFTMGARLGLALSMAGMLGCGGGGGGRDGIDTDPGLDTGLDDSDDHDDADDDDDDDDDDDAAEEPSGFGPGGLRLLTPTQYENSVVDVLGDVAAEPVGQWRSSIAAAQGGVAPAQVELYADAAHDVAAQVFSDPVARAALAGCEPSLSSDDACLAAVVTQVGRRAWRRTLTNDEVARYVSVALETADLLGGDAWIGLQYAVAGLLQSPNFLYRVELGDPVGDEGAYLQLRGIELASRLSYLVWNTTPDDALLDAAEGGELDTLEGLVEHAQRLLDDPRAEDGLIQVFVDAYDLDALLSLQKDATLLPAFTETLGPSMRAEIVRVVAHVLFEEADLRALFETQQGYVDAELAALYGIDGAFGVEPVAVTLPEERGGLLTLAGFLAIYSGEASTSPTNRGLAVRRTIMCQQVPPPPPDVEADLPEPGEGDEPMTKREQLEQHAVDPACSGCHNLTDPIGLALEHFDAIGGYRATDNGLPIDPSGDLDGVPFADATALGTALSEHPASTICTVRNLYRYAVGHIEQSEENETIQTLVAAVEDEGHDLRAAVAALVASDGFRFVTAPGEGEEGGE